jgi:hypothetical protein
MVELIPSCRPRGTMSALPVPRGDELLHIDWESLAGGHANLDRALEIPDERWSDSMTHEVRRARNPERSCTPNPQ